MTTKKGKGITSRTRQSGKPEYEVGYGKPPQNTRFKKGSSGNPSWRPTIASKVARHPLFETLLEEVNAVLSAIVEIKDGGDVKKVTLSRAIMGVTAREAAKGDGRLALLLYRLALELNDRKAAALEQAFDLAAVYKDFWTKELAARACNGITLPHPVPHPDDIVLNWSTGDVSCKGIMLQEKYDEVATMLKEHEDEIALCEGLKKDPEYSEYSDFLDEEIAREKHFAQTCRRWLHL